MIAPMGFRKPMAPCVSERTKSIGRRGLQGGPGVSSSRSLRRDQPDRGPSRTHPAASASSEQGDPAVPSGFGLATATFVVISSMVGVGVLTTSGYTVVAVGSNQLMLGLWLIGGII